MWSRFRQHGRGSSAIEMVPEVKVGQRHYGGPLYGVTVGPENDLGHRWPSLQRQVDCQCSQYLVRVSDAKRRLVACGEVQNADDLGPGCEAAAAERRTGEEVWILSVACKTIRKPPRPSRLSPRDTESPQLSGLRRNTSRADHGSDCVDLRINRSACNAPWSALWALSDHQPSPEISRLFRALVELATSLAVVFHSNVMPATLLPRGNGDSGSHRTDGPKHKMAVS